MTAFNGAKKAFYHIRVRSTDTYGLWFEKSFTITVADFEPEAPGSGGTSNGGGPSSGGTGNTGGTRHAGGSAGEEPTEKGSDDSGCGCRQAPGALDTTRGLHPGEFSC